MDSVWLAIKSILLSLVSLAFWIVLVVGGFRFTAPGRWFFEKKGPEESEEENAS